MKYGFRCYVFKRTIHQKNQTIIIIHLEKLKFSSFLHKGQPNVLSLPRNLKQCVLASWNKPAML